MFIDDCTVFTFLDHYAFARIDQCPNSSLSSSNGLWQFDFWQSLCYIRNSFHILTVKQALSRYSSCVEIMGWNQDETTCILLKIWKQSLRYYGKSKTHYMSLVYLSMYQNRLTLYRRYFPEISGLCLIKWPGKTLQRLNPKLLFPFHSTLNTFSSSPDQCHQHRTFKFSGLFPQTCTSHFWRVENI